MGRNRVGFRLPDHRHHNHGGKVDAPRPQRIFWATVEGLFTIVSLLGGGLSALQAGVTATAIPFSIVMLLMCYTIIKALNGELGELGQLRRRPEPRFRHGD